MTDTGGKPKANTLSDLADAISTYAQEVQATPDIQIKEHVLRQFKKACHQVSSSDDATKELTPNDLYSAYLNNAMTHYIQFLMLDREKQTGIETILHNDKPAEEREFALYEETMNEFRREIKARLTNEFD